MKLVVPFTEGAAPIYSEEPRKWYAALADCKPDLGHVSCLFFYHTNTELLSGM
jgi:hypothetical protein